MSDFVKVQKKKKVNGVEDPTVANEVNLKALKESLLPMLTTLKESDLYQEITKSLLDAKITKIRCLALGSPSQERAALYQFALLQLLKDHFGIQSDFVSLYDPVFNELDDEFLKSYDCQVEEDYKPEIIIDEVLYFLPHAPLNLTNMILSTESPKLLLANNIITHTDRLTKQELFEKYPIISKFVHIIQKDNTGATLTNLEQDDFQPVVKKKNRRQKAKFVEKPLDYSSVDSYFEKIEFKSFKQFEEGPWLNSFTDIAFHKVL